MRRLIPFSFLFLTAVACGVTIETEVQTSSSPTYSIFSAKILPDPPRSAQLPPSAPALEISPKVIPKESELPYRKQFIISVLVDKNLDSAFTIQILGYIDYGIKQWNQALGYDVFSLLEGDKTLLIEYKDVLASRQDVIPVGGYYHKKNCTNQYIEIFKTKGSNIRQVVMHELGHALGLSHSEIIGDVMYHSTKYTVIFLSENDIKRAKEAIKTKCK